MDRDRNIQSLGLGNLFLLLFIGGATQMLALYASSATGQVGVVFLAMGVLVAAVSAFQMRLKAREKIEQLEYDELKKSASASALFSQEADTFPARRSREQFDKWFVPGFTIILCVLQGLGAFLLWKWLDRDQGLNTGRGTIALALASLFSLIFFMRGKYVAGIARLENHRLLRPAASYLLLGSLMTLLMALAEAVGYFSYPHIDVIVARVLCVVLGFVALETLITLILEIYRPRLKGQAARLLYESRLIGLLGQPGGLITTAAQALDYQFGFKVSETWFYRFAEKALAWLVLLQLGVLLLSTCVVVIEAPEQGLLERWGRPVAGREILEPGLHLKWPWPVDKVHRYRSREVHTFYLGFVPDPDADREKVLVWTKSHFKEEYNMLVASREQGYLDPSSAAGGEQVVPVNLISVNIPVQYRIKDLHAYVYKHSEANNLLELLANRALSHYLVNVDIDDVMGAGRLAAAKKLREEIQKTADENELGVEVIFVGLQGIHPPVKVAPDYEAVIGAFQEKQSNILSAQAYWAEKIPQAHAEASNTVLTAWSDSYSKVTIAQAEAAQYTNQLAAYDASPSVYKERSYLETLVRAVGPARKYVLGVTNTHDIIWLNLEDKIRSDLLDVPLPTGKK